MNELNWIETADGGRTDTLEEICSDLGIDTSETVGDITLDNLITETTLLKQQETDAWTEFEIAIDEVVNAGQLQDNGVMIEVYTVNRDEPQQGKSFVGLVNSGSFETSSTNGGTPEVTFTTETGENYQGPLVHFSFSSGKNR